MWTLEQKHPVYGSVAMMRTIEGEPYRFFVDKHGTVSMIPLIVLQLEEKLDQEVVSQ